MPPSIYNEPFLTTAVPISDLVDASGEPTGQILTLMIEPRAEIPNRIQAGGIGAGSGIGGIGAIGDILPPNHPQPEGTEENQ
jgi:hypothetical protein